MLKVDKNIKNSLIAQSISERTWEYDLLTGETDIITSLTTFLDYNKSEIRNHIDFWLTLIHPDDIEAVLTALNDVRKNKKDDFITSYRIRLKDESYMWIESRGKALKDEQGKNIYMAGLHLEIRPYRQFEETEQKYQTLLDSVAEELKEITDRNKKIIDLSPLGVYVVRNGIITYANKPGLKLFGAKCNEEVIGRPRLDFIAHSYQQKAIKRENTIIKNCEVEPVIEMELLKVDGTKFIGEVYSAPLPSKDGLLGLTYINDITEKKRMTEENKKLLQQAIEYDRFKTEFFSNISHELRTPLNIILSAIQLLNSNHSSLKENCSNFTDSCARYIAIMKQNAFRLLKLIDNIIDLTKIDAGYYQINLENHNIITVVEDITLSVVEYVESKEIELIFDTDTEEKIIACDNEKIERIMLNLLSNAVKYTKAGGTINVDIKDLDTHLVIIVKDTGTGIPNEKLDLIFERFRQVDELLTRRAEGSGIGLSLVKFLVEAHGGTISVKSIQGMGSEFIILLPCSTIENNKTTYKPLDSIHNEDYTQKKVERICIEFSDIYK